MADVQSELIKFHNIIKVEEDDLRKSRDALVDKIKVSLKDNGHRVPDVLNQGSYIYGVGIEPIGDLEHDIDVGLEFPICSDDYKATEIRSWVFDAVNGHTKNEPIEKNSCIRVPYQDGYHVDLVCYAKFKSSDDEKFDNINPSLGLKDGSWRPSEPRKLKDFIESKFKLFENTCVPGAGNQIQRVVRYLKRWNDEAIPYESPGKKPVGLAILLYCIEHLTPQLRDGTSDDLKALEVVVEQAANTIGKIVCFKPTQEYEDVFSKLTDSGMNALKKRFEVLLSTLREVQNENSLEAACEKMRGVFGEDFPKGKQKSVSSRDIDERLDKAVAAVSSPTKPWSAL